MAAGGQLRVGRYDGAADCDREGRDADGDGEAGQSLEEGAAAPGVPGRAALAGRADRAELGRGVGQQRDVAQCRQLDGRGLLEPAERDRRSGRYDGRGLRLRRRLDVGGGNQGGLDSGGRSGRGAGHRAGRGRGGHLRCSDGGLRRGRGVHRSGHALADVGRRRRRLVDRAPGSSFPDVRGGCRGLRRAVVRSVATHQAADSLGGRCAGRFRPASSSEAPSGSDTTWLSGDSRAKHARPTLTDAGTAPKSSVRTCGRLFRGREQGRAGARPPAWWRTWRLTCRCPSGGAEAARGRLPHAPGRVG
ncbi:hypothetical protein L615_000100000300 [Nocardioides sp. J9]|nr:hypothetical protein L615_000100000300 [Nocardioides sp. J9]